MSTGESSLLPIHHLTLWLFLCCQGSWLVPVLVRQDTGWGQIDGQFRTIFSTFSKLYRFKPKPWRLVCPSAALPPSTFTLGSFSWGIGENRKVIGEGLQKAVLVTRYPSDFDTLFKPVVGFATSVALDFKVVLLEWPGKEISVNMPHRGHS